MQPRYTQPLSVMVWNAASTGVNGRSATFDSYNCPWISAFGSVSGATTIKVMCSQDGANWYASPYSTAPTGAGTFSLDFQSGAEFIALQSSANVTATAIISGK